jgi:NAD(P)-dependent dehydrogenase (short-subunit alcohol dehydrogenase family)
MSMSGTASNGDWLGLAGRVAVVTGAASGIGRATANSLSSVGAAVALLDINIDGAKEAAQAIAETGGRAVAVGCDTTDEASIAKARKEVEASLGGADILVNNAGILRPGGLDKLSIADWNKILAVNLTGYLLVAQAFGEGMRQRRRGAIVHIASIAATEPQPWSGAYSTAKAGVHMLSRQLAYEWGPEGVRSNVVSPGFVRTALSESYYQVSGVLEARSRLVPVGRVAAPEDMANAITFLVSDKASYVSGAELLVDGGANTILMGQVPRPGYERST